MSYFYDFESIGSTLKRMSERLLELRQKLTQEVPPRNLEDSLLLATWNIREFDSTKGGERNEESLAYIAEIISSFDLVAITGGARGSKCTGTPSEDAGTLVGLYRHGRHGRATRQS